MKIHKTKPTVRIAVIVGGKLVAGQCFSTPDLEDADPTHIMQSIGAWLAGEIGQPIEWQHGIGSKRLPGKPKKADPFAGLNQTQMEE